jgi:hypothetical protein
VKARTGSGPLRLRALNGIDVESEGKGIEIVADEVFVPGL